MSIGIVEHMHHVAMTMERAKEIQRMSRIRVIATKTIVTEEGMIRTSHLIEISGMGRGNCFWTN